MIDRTSVLCSGRAASGAPGAVFGDGPRNHGPTQPGPADVDGPLRVSAGCTLPAVPVSWSPGHRSLGPSAFPAFDAAVLGLPVCCRARGTDRNWTRVDRKMSWSPAASSTQQRARVLTDVKARRFAPPPLRGADGLDAGSAHARPDWLLPTMLTHTPPTCCGRRPVQNDALSGDR